MKQQCKIITHHDQIIFFLSLQVWVNVRKDTSVTHFSNKLEVEGEYRSIDTEKFLFLSEIPIKSLRKIEIKNLLER